VWHNSNASGYGLSQRKRICVRGHGPVRSVRQAVCEDDRMFATLHTNHGDIRLELFPNHAPKTVENFVGLAEGTKEFSDP